MWLYETQENAYYPFGLAHTGTDFTLGTNGNNFQYNGKEKINSFSLNYSDYGFRTYDLLINRFISVDPISEKFPELTTYQYASNNPVLNIDLDGLEGMAYYLTQKYIEFKVKTMNSTQQLKGASRNLVSGRSGYIPASIDVNPITRSQIKSNSKLEDQSTVVQESKTIALEGTITTAEIGEDIGDGIETAGIVTGQPQVAATGAAISTGAKIVKFGAKATKGEDISNDVAFEIGKEVILRPASKVGSAGIKKGHLTQQVDNIYQGVVHSWDKMMDFIYGKTQESDSSKTKKNE